MDHLQAVNTLAAERYLLDEMTDAERDEFEGHFFSCRDCADDLRVGRGHGGRGAQRPHQQRRDEPQRPEGGRHRSSRGADGARRSCCPGPPRHHLRSRPDTWPCRFRVQVRSCSRPRRCDLPLGGRRPPSRPVPAASLTLAVDLSGAAFTGPLRYELLREGGSVLASGDATAPPAGAPLLLSIPSSLLGPEGRYILRVHGSGSGGLTEEDYRFRVGP